MHLLRSSSRPGLTEPRCSDACPTGALSFGDEEDAKIKELIAKAELLKPEVSTRPRVYYLTPPKKWIAGAVYDPEADLCTEGATVTATNQKTGVKVSTTTDNYGDFWLKDLTEGTYTILIEKEGYLTQKLGPIDTSLKDQNLGDMLCGGVEAGREYMLPPHGWRTRAISSGVGRQHDPVLLYVIYAETTQVLGEQRRSSGNGSRELWDSLGRVDKTVIKSLGQCSFALTASLLN